MEWRVESLYSLLTPSFYVYTNGVYNNAANDATSPMEASFYVEDTKGYITDAKVEKIMTGGKWEQHYLYIATHPLLSSSIKLTNSFSSFSLFTLTTPLL